MEQVIDAITDLLATPTVHMLSIGLVILMLKDKK